MEGAIKRPIGSPNIFPVLLKQFTCTESVFVSIYAGKVSCDALVGETSGLQLILGSCVD